MVNEIVIRTFCQSMGATLNLTGSHCSVRNGVLFSYETPIARWEGGRIKLNYYRFSQTTRVQQNHVLRYAPGLVDCYEKKIEVTK